MNADTMLYFSASKIGSGSVDRRNRWIAAIVAPLALVPFMPIVDSLMGRETTLVAIVLTLLLAVSCITDLLWRKIFNYVTYVAAGWAVVINTMNEIVPADVTERWIPLGAIGLSNCLFGFSICFFVMLFAYQLAGGGAGDVKLAGAIGSLIGVQSGLMAFALTYIVAGSAVLLWGIWVNGPWRIAKTFGKQFGRLVLPSVVSPLTDDEQCLLARQIPMAPFFAIGTLLTIVFGM